jgi:uncharacterized membrane protein YedE/YeeE
MQGFTPIGAIVGGALIAMSLALVLVGTGRIAGLSGVFAGFLRGEAGDWAWRALFLAGAIGAGAVFAFALPSTFDHAAPAPLWLVATSGLLVGVGTRLSNGCTSGHGLCGTSRLSRRSLVATAVFFGLGVLTATVIGHALRAGA